MGVFVGLDVSLAKTAVCVVDRDGVVLWQGKVPSEPGPLVTRLAEWSGKIDLAGIEACPLSEWLHRGLFMGRPVCRPTPDRSESCLVSANVCRGSAPSR